MFVSKLYLNRLFAVFTISVLAQGCTHVSTGISQNSANKLPSYMVAQTDITCKPLDTIKINKGTKFEMLSLEGVEYNAGFGSGTFPDNAVMLDSGYRNALMGFGINGPVLFPNGKFVFEEAHYVSDARMMGYTLSPDKCEFTGNEPFKMVRN